ncbi:MAG: DUF1211 domain-containing protein [Bacteroidetes bacterium]|nr:DUF1211 domain-containing protein [Bacteroidota bacterium]
MFRKQVAKKKSKDHIVWRGQEVTRIEAFSDAVFAFAVTLLIVSLEVPHDYEELMDNLKFFVPFGLSFLIMFTIWYRQNIFFRRYGLHDIKTVALNGILLFLVLVYMFPLKFLFGALFGQKFHFQNTGQLSTIFSLYCGGFGAFYLLFGFMYMNAYVQRDHIRLSEVEAFQTKTHAYTNMIVAGVSLLAVGVAFSGGYGAYFAGWTFFLVWPFTAITETKRKKIFNQRFGDIAAPEVVHQMHAHHIEQDAEAKN